VGAVLVAAVAFVAILALASGTGFAGGYHPSKHQYGPGGDQYKPATDQYGGRHGKKLVICHKGRHTIVVSFNSWWAHKRHGSFLGRCDRAKFRAWKLQRQIEALEALLARLKEKQARLAAQEQDD
jgi:hypothetical protein